jgi:hypothetical protein
MILYNLIYYIESNDHSSGLLCTCIYFYRKYSNVINERRYSPVPTFAMIESISKINSKI